MFERLKEHQYKEEHAMALGNNIVECDEISDIERMWDQVQFKTPPLPNTSLHKSS